MRKAGENLQTEETAGWSWGLEPARCVQELQAVQRPLWKQSVDELGSGGQKPLELPNRRQSTEGVPTLSPTHDSRKRVAPRATGNTQGQRGSGRTPGSRGSL